eukprot:4510660-Ditylum_brightwellii.AAC.1
MEALVAQFSCAAVNLLVTAPLVTLTAPDPMEAVLHGIKRAICYWGVLPLHEVSDGGGVLCLHPFVPGLQVVVLGNERCNVVNGLALLGGVVLVRHTRSAIMLVLGDMLLAQQAEQWEQRLLLKLLLGE